MTPGTVAHQAPLSMGFFRQEYWSGLPFPSPDNLPDPEIKSRSPALQVDSLPFELQGRPCLTVSFLFLVPVIPEKLAEGPFEKGEGEGFHKWQFFKALSQRSLIFLSFKCPWFCKITHF